MPYMSWRNMILEVSYLLFDISNFTRSKKCKPATSFLGYRTGKVHLILAFQAIIHTKTKLMIFMNFE